MKITIKNNTETLFGDASQSLINTVDIESTVENYYNAIRNSIRRYWAPDELEIEFYFGSYSGKSLILEDADNAQNEERIVESIGSMIEIIYNLGDFWVAKKSVAARSMGKAKKSVTSAANGRKGGRPKKVI